MERRIILFLVFKAFMQSIHGQSPILDIDRDSTSEGSSFTLNCSVAINDAITFKLDNVAQGTCGAPFLGVLGSCTPNIITQNLSDSVTSWTISPALIAHRGSWKCTRGTTDSNVVTLKLYKLPVAVLTQNGISSDITVNDTSSYPISIEVGCLFSEDGPTVELEFVAAGASNASASMSCSNSSTACSGCTGCSAYSCSHDISVNQGGITIDTPYTLQIKVGVTGTTQTFSSAVFSPHSIMFEGTSPTSQISTVLSIERSTTVKMYSSSNVTTPMSTTGITSTSYIPATTTSNTDTSNFFENTETNNYFVNVDTESTTSASNTELTNSYTNTETTNFYAKSEFTMSYANTEASNVYDDIETRTISKNTKTNEIEEESSSVLSDQSIILTSASIINSGSFLTHTTSHSMTVLFESLGYFLSSYNEKALSSTFKTNHLFSQNFPETSMSYVVNTQHGHLIWTLSVNSDSLTTMNSSKYSVLSLTIPPSHFVETFIATLSNLFLVQTASTDITDSTYTLRHISRVSRSSFLTEIEKTLNTIPNVDASAANIVFNSGRSESLLLNLSINNNFNQRVFTSTEPPIMHTSLSFDINLYSSNMLESSFSPNQLVSETIVTLTKKSVSNKLRSSTLKSMEHFINTNPILITSNLIDPVHSIDDFLAITHSVVLQTTDYQAEMQTEFTSYVTKYFSKTNTYTGAYSTEILSSYMHLSAMQFATQFGSINGVKEPNTKFQSANFEPYSPSTDKVFSLEMSENFPTDLQSSMLSLPHNTKTNTNGIDSSFAITRHTTHTSFNHNNISSTKNHLSQHTNTDASYMKIDTSFKNSLFSSSSFSESFMFDDQEIKSASFGVFKSVSTISKNTIQSGISEKTKNIIFISTVSALVTFIVVVLLTLVFARIYLPKDNVKPTKKHEIISWSSMSRSPMTTFPTSFTGGNIHPLLNTSSASCKMSPYEHYWNDIV